MNADEYDTKETLLLSRIVAFEDVRYYYRQHKSNVTKITTRMFDCCMTDWLQLNMFKRICGHGSYEYRVMENVYVNSCSYYLNLFNKNKKILEQTQESRHTVLCIRQLLKSCFRNLTAEMIWDSSLRKKDKIKLFFRTRMF